MVLQAYDQKNIRRRVYDALNVLMAMNIISKEKKEIKWIGLPTNSAQECQQLEVAILFIVKMVFFLCISRKTYVLMKPIDVKVYKIIVKVFF